MSNPLTPLARVVSAAMKEAGLSENAASIRSGIPRQTLRRRLVTGDFKYETELVPLADVLEIPASELVDRAQRAAA